MPLVESVEARAAGFVARLRREDGFVYETQQFATADEALRAGRTWLDWYSNVANGTVESIYYILAVPDNWLGPPEGSHRYSGLRVKIGRARDVRKRLANLRTGSAADLICACT
ncbi:MAG: GIY-YIG nuclease family protein [Dehalococcoidia bacterium]